MWGTKGPLQGDIPTTAPPLREVLELKGKNVYEGDSQSQEEMSWNPPFLKQFNPDNNISAMCHFSLRLK